ncbi:glycosyltransferase family 4 protein [Polaribacter gochangensis]|uniref:glycosyltransferase family 4 protein n=1 Tax=Polaribacter gochangensis TaxID=3252903 RepID=UPI0039048E2A
MKKSSILYIGNDLSEKSKYNSTMETLSKLLESDGMTIYKSSNKLNKLVRLLHMSFSVIKYRKKVDYILIDTFSTVNFYYAFITSQLARIFNIKYISILHGGNLPIRLVNSKILSKMIFANSFKNVAPSNYLKIAFEKKNYETVFIPNILEIENYSYKERKNIRPNILWVRSFCHIYNPTMAIEVLYLVKKEFPKATLCMVGPVKDDSINLVKAKVKEYQLEKSVEFTGVLPKEKWHKKSVDYDIFINTTNFDNTPVSIMEAMALGLIVVSTNAGGMPYLIDNDVDGILVDKENAKQMADQICNVLKKQHIRFTKRAREKAETFGWEIVKDKWIKLLR